MGIEWILVCKALPDGDFRQKVVIDCYASDRGESGCGRLRSRQQIDLRLQWWRTVSVIRQNSVNEYASVGDTQALRSAQTMAFEPKSKRLFLSATGMQPMPATSKGQNARAKPKPGTFVVLVVEPQ
jgi:hypothetical protein